MCPRIALPLNVQIGSRRLEQNRRVKQKRQSAEHDGFGGSPLYRQNSGKVGEICTDFRDVRIDKASTEC